MKWMSLTGFLLFFGLLQTAQTSVFEVNVTTKEKPVIGHLALLRFEIKNISDQRIVILEIRPVQPCEESVTLVRSLYGRIDYDEKADEYLYDPQTQSATMIPVVEGFLLPGQTLWLNLKYRPFAVREEVLVVYALAGEQKIYARTQGGGSPARFTVQGNDYGQVILSRLMELDRQEEKVHVSFPGISGEASKLCYCETLKTYIDFLPYSLCKEWDSGITVKFRVGEKQEGMGPDRKHAGWKFLNEFSVYYGDGMYTHGEFVDVPPELARVFTEKIQEKYSITRISYFFTEHYYDLEPTL